MHPRRGTRIGWLGLVFAAFGLATAPARAQAPPAGAAFVAPPQEHLLLGDWLGGLGAEGVYLNLDAITEFAGNVSGGTRQGATFANQVAFEADLDWQRLAGITGFSTHLIAVSRSGSNDSALFGDHLLPVQEIYGSGGNVLVHLVSFYAEETLPGKWFDLEAGRMNVENDFASSNLYCNYMNNMLCGDPKALPGGDIGHSAYPEGVWAGRIKLQPTGSAYVETGAYEVNRAIYTNQGFRSGFNWGTQNDRGVYIPVEAAWQPLLGADKLPGHYKIGFGWDSSNFPGYDDIVTRAGATASVRHTNTQSWVLIDQMLVRQGHGDADGIIALAGFTHNDPNNSVYAEQYFLGVIDRGFWAARPEDTIALLFDLNTVSGRLGKAEAAALELGLPLTPWTATGVQTHEEVFEANYAIHVIPGLTFQPDFQYVFRPNAQSNIRDAAVLGFRAHLVF